MAKKAFFQTRKKTWLTRVFSKLAPTHTFTHTYLEVKFFFGKKDRKKNQRKILEEF